ncbi:hypothetical protein [Candidatus Nitrosocosmicus sp. FF01]|uniref:hypothetical protein n=1 Tax=Candidatus Nitrosocosmicus sp. FF01 TaxID=3397670 RepID=UPI0039E9A667
MFPLLTWFWKATLLQDTIASSPETHWLLWLEDCDWPMPCSAELPLPFPLPPDCKPTLLPLFSWFWKETLLQEASILPPATHWLLWLEDCDWPMAWAAELPLPFPLPPVLC